MLKRTSALCSDAGSMRWHRAAFIGRFDDPVEPLGGISTDRQQAHIIDLCRHRMSATHNLFGAAAVNLRSTRSGARWAAGSAMVVLGDLRLFAPRKPRSRMTRSTEQRDTSTPLLRNMIHVLRDPRRLLSGWSSRSSAR